MSQILLSKSEIPLFRIPLPSGIFRFREAKKRMLVPSSGWNGTEGGQIRSGIYTSLSHDVTGVPFLNLIPFLHVATCRQSSRKSA